MSNKPYWYIRSTAFFSFSFLLLLSVFAKQSWSLETVCSSKQRCIEGHIAAFLTVKDISE